jgi:four helix bundle protein
MQDYKKLLVWSKAHKLTLNIYKVTKVFPKEEVYSLTSQLRRASSSVAVNIVEGCGRKTKLDKANFMQIAFSSAQETEYLIFLCTELEYLNAETYKVLEKEIVEIKIMLTALMKRIRE